MIPLLESIETLIALLALYVVASPRVAERAYHPALFEPHKYPQGHYESEFAKSGRFHDLFFPTPTGNQLHAWYFRGETGAKTILFCHGNSGNISDLEGHIELLLQTGASVFVFDYQGFGRSQGRPSVSGICADAHAAHKYLVEKLHVSPNDIVLYGESLGGAVACELARREPIAGLILQSTFSCLTRISFENYAILGIFPEFLFPPPYFNNVAVLRDSIKVPVLVTHGEKDTEIRIAHAHALIACATGPKQMVGLPNTEHSEIAALDHELFVCGLREFLHQLTDREASQPDQSQIRLSMQER
jgi:alpha-beta hydrolase superfamily lysophospholipase